MPKGRLQRAGHAARAIVIVASIGATDLAAQEGWNDFRSARQVQGVESLRLELLYGAGGLTIGSADGSFLYDARLRYDASRLEPLRDWRRDGDDARLRFALSSRPDGSDENRATVQIDDWDVEFDLEDLPRNADESAELDVRINPDVSTQLRLGVGTGRTTLDLGGLTLESVEFGTGASDVHLEFDAPNQRRMETLSIKSGAAEFTGEGLGNARFDLLEFMGVVGDVVLDFDGAWGASAEADIKMGLGELVLRIPRGIGVRIERSGLASIDAEGFEKVGDLHISPEWTEADVRFDIRVAAGLGKIRVERS